MDKHRPISPQRKKQLAWTALVIFVLLTAAVCWFVGRPMLRFVSEPEKFRLWVDGHGLWGAGALCGDVLFAGGRRHHPR